MVSSGQSIRHGLWKTSKGEHMQVDERKAYLQVRLRNLKRKYARVKEHADQVEDAIELKCEIDSIERELNN